MTMIIDGSNGVTFPNSTVQASAGSVLQVVNATYSTFVTSSNNTLVDLGLSATITPKFATSKILVIVDINGTGKVSTNTALRVVLVRNSTAILKIDDDIAETDSTTNSFVGSSSANYLDSPATTSATTYKIQYCSSANTGAVYINNYWAAGGTNSTMTLMEIAQ